jgi:predicted transcriptional regulator
MEEKGLLAHAEEGGRYVYSPTTTKRRAGKSALSHLVDTFYDGSVADAVAALLSASSPTEEDLEQLEALIAKAKKEGR